MSRAARALLAAALLAAPAAAMAPRTPAEVAPIPEARWSYPRGGRDPLVPPPALYADLPALSLTVAGVDGQRPDRPLAVVRLDGTPPVRRVVRPGERVGPYRVLSIRPGRVRVAAPALGGTRTLELSLRDSSPSTP